MSRWYIDTSAAAKLLVEEGESAALAHTLDASQPDLVACYLLETEMRRVASRVTSLTQRAATQVLDAVDLYDVPPSLFREAGLLPGDLRSLDALHCAAAIRIGVDAMLTYDARLTVAAGRLGLTVVAPGTSGSTS